MRLGLRGEYRIGKKNRAGSAQFLLSPQTARLRLFAVRLS